MVGAKLCSAKLCSALLGGACDATRCAALRCFDLKSFLDPCGSAKAGSDVELDSYLLMLQRRAGSGRIKCFVSVETAPCCSLGFEIQLGLATGLARGLNRS